MCIALSMRPPGFRPSVAWMAFALIVLGCGVLLYASDFVIAPPSTIETSNRIDDSKAVWPVKPSRGVVVAGQVVEVYDGDTATVQILWRVRVRLLDCWADEVRTKDPAEKKRGLAAKAHAERIALGKRCTLFIPADDIKTLGDLTSMGRVLGHVWLEGETKTLSQQMVEAGHATRVKAETTSSEVLSKQPAERHFCPP